MIYWEIPTGQPVISSGSIMTLGVYLNTLGDKQD